MALIVVLALVGLAALMGLALLSNASLQAEVSSGLGKREAAAYNADSAIETAAYYLQKSSAMPASWGTTPGYVIYAHNQTIPGVDGSFDIEATVSGADKYNVTVVGRSNGSSAVTRTARAQVLVNRVKPNVAGGFGGGIMIPARHTFNGPVVASGSVLLWDLTALVNGLVSTTRSATDYVPPTLATINYYGSDVVGGTYTMPDGTLGTPQLIASPLVAAPVANAGNPGKVFYTSGNLVISGNQNISGTIIARGTVTFQGGPNTITITPVSGFPALIATGTINILSTNVKVNLNGVVWAGGGTAWTGLFSTGSVLTINGALLMPAGVTMGSPLPGGSGVINYVSANCNVPNLTKTAQAGTSVKYVSWNP